MRRDELARLLSSGTPAAIACRRALLDGARFTVDETARGAVPASRLAPTYALRQEHTARVGIPTLGFAAAVEALRRHGDQGVRLGSVRVDDPAYHYVLFLDEPLSRLVAVIGVDQRIAYRLRPGDPVLVSAEAVGWADRSFPGWIRVQLVDASGRPWQLTDKAPVFDADATDETAFPVPVAVRGVVTDLRPPDAGDGPPLVVVSTAPDGLTAEDGTDEFILPGEALGRVPCQPG